MEQEKQSKFIEKLKQFFNRSNQIEDSFTLASPYEESKDTNSLNTNQLQENQKIFEAKEIFSSLTVTIEYLKVKYNAMINSDIILREFTLSARNRQYKALLFFIDGMVDSQLINNNVLQALMLRNRANIFDGDQNQIVSEAKTNNITVRRVKKFDLENFVFDC